MKPHTMNTTLVTVSTNRNKSKKDCASMTKGEKQRQSLESGLPQSLQKQYTPRAETSQALLSCQAPSLEITLHKLHIYHVVSDFTICQCCLCVI